MASKITPNAYAKPPRRSDEEIKERRRKIGLGLMGMYKVFGWLQPVGEEWQLEVATWAAGLAFVPTCDLMTAFTDALAQPDAPKPLNLEYVKRVYNGIVGQGMALVSADYHRPYLPTPEPLRPCLPAGPSPDPEAARAAAQARAAQICAAIEDPDLRRVFGGICKASLLPLELRVVVPADAEAPAPVAGLDASAKRPRNGREYLETLRASEAIPDWLREDLVKREAAQADAQRKQNENEQTNAAQTEDATARHAPTEDDEDDEDAQKGKRKKREASSRIYAAEVL